MKNSRFSEEKIIAVLKRAEAGVKVSELVRKQGISDATFYNWKAKYGRLTYPITSMPSTIAGVATVIWAESVPKRLNQLTADDHSVSAESWYLQFDSPIALAQTCAGATCAR